MAKRKKNRTHLKGGVASAGASATAHSGVPTSFVIRHGPVGRSLAQLVRDVRRMMEPHTASRLKERARNKLRDFLVLAPALGVTHLLAIGLAPTAPMLRLVRLPAGPSLTFRVERYALCRDVRASMRHAKSIGMEYLSPPLLVLASFPPPNDPNTPAHLPLTMKAFQSLFPPLAPHSLALSSARRVVLVAYVPERGTIELRHYTISVRASGVSKRVRKVLDNHDAPDLGRVNDVADYVLRASGYESATSDGASSAGEEDGAGTVALASDYVGRGNTKGARRAVRLDEVGPRMELRLVKISEGVPGKEGEVIYHEFVKKTKKEVVKQRAEHQEREKLRKQRREEQEKNVARKKAEAEAGGSKNEAKGKRVAFEDDGDGTDGDDDEMHEVMSEGETAADDDDGWDEEAELEDVSDASEDDSDSGGEEAQAPPLRRRRK